MYWSIHAPRLHGTVIQQYDHRLRPIRWAERLCLRLIRDRSDSYLNGFDGVEGMTSSTRWIGAFLLVTLASGCATTKQFTTLRQPTDRDLQTYIGGTIVKLDAEESLPNAFGGADIYGGRRQVGSTELKYLGLGSEGTVKLRVLSTDVKTTEDWRRRLGNKGTVTSSSDAVDFAQRLDQPFEIEGVTVLFLRADGAGITYRLSRQLAKR